MNKLTIEYDPENGLAFTDNKAKEHVDHAIKNRFITPHIIVGTELLIDLFRCAVIEKKIKHTEIKFLFKGKTIDIDKYGTCKEYPKGFGDVNLNVLSRMLKWD